MLKLSLTITQELLADSNKPQSEVLPTMLADVPRNSSVTSASVDTCPRSSSDTLSNEAFPSNDEARLSADKSTAQDHRSTSTPPTVSDREGAGVRDWGRRTKWGLSDTNSQPIGRRSSNKDDSDGGRLMRKASELPLDESSSHPSGKRIRTSGTASFTDSHAYSNDSSRRSIDRSISERDAGESNRNLAEAVQSPGVTSQLVISEPRIKRIVRNIGEGGILELASPEDRVKKMNEA